jgi:hypothetical protein
MQRCIRSFYQRMVFLFIDASEPSLQFKLVAIPVNRPWRAIGLWDVEALTFLDNRFRDGGPEYSWCSFLLWGWVDPRAIVGLEGVGQMKNPMNSSRVNSVGYTLQILRYQQQKNLMWNHRKQSFHNRHKFFLAFRLPFSTQKFPTCNLVSFRFAITRHISLMEEQSIYFTFQTSE